MTMNGLAIIAVIEPYERRLAEEGVPVRRIDPSRTFGSCSKAELLAHAHYLCGNVRRFANDPDKFGKLNRHLTALQMCLSFADWYSLDELMAHNLPIRD